MTNTIKAALQARVAARPHSRLSAAEPSQRCQSVSIRKKTARCGNSIASHCASAWVDEYCLLAAKVDHGGRYGVGHSVTSLYIPRG